MAARTPRGTTGESDQCRSGQGGKLTTSTRYARWHAPHERVLCYLREQIRPFKRTFTTPGGVRLRLYANELALPEREIAAAVGVGRQVVRSALCWLRTHGLVNRRLRPFHLYKCPWIYRVRPKPNPEGSGVGLRYTKVYAAYQGLLSSKPKVTSGAPEIRSGFLREALAAFERAEEARQWLPGVAAYLRRFHAAGKRAAEIVRIAWHARRAGPGRHGPCLLWLLRTRLLWLRVQGKEVLNLADWLRRAPVLVAAEQKRGIISVNRIEGNDQGETLVRGNLATSSGRKRLIIHTSLRQQFCASQDDEVRSQRHQKFQAAAVWQTFGLLLDQPRHIVEKALFEAHVKAELKNFFTFFLAHRREVTSVHSERGFWECFESWKKCSEKGVSHGANR